MCKILVLQGIPASGKSTWAKEFVKGKIDWIIINKDSLRLMKGDYWVPKHEILIKEWESYCVKSAILKGFNVIIDGTNLNSNIIEYWKNLAKELNCEIDYKGFAITLEEAVERDSKRELKVGRKVITNFYNRYVKN